MSLSLDLWCKVYGQARHHIGKHGSFLNVVLIDAYRWVFVLSKCLQLSYWTICPICLCRVDLTMSMETRGREWIESRGLGWGKGSSSSRLVKVRPCLQVNRLKQIELEYLFITLFAMLNRWDFAEAGTPAFMETPSPLLFECCCCTFIRSRPNERFVKLWRGACMVAPSCPLGGCPYCY